MPASCANAFAPTIGLVRLGRRSRSAARRAAEAGRSRPGRCRCRPRSSSWRTRSAITISSSAAFPARSPMPFTVHSTCPTPASTAASEFATARPRSSWQCAESSDVSSSGQRRRTSPKNHAYSFGQRVADRVGQVDDVGAGLDRLAADARDERRVGTRRVLAGELDLVDASRARRRPPRRACATTSSGVRPQLLLHVDRARRQEDVDARAARVPRARRRAASRSSRRVRASEATVARRDDARRPRGRLRSRRATRLRSRPRSRRRRAARAAPRSLPSRSGRRAMPGDCSPSRKCRVEDLDPARTHYNLLSRARLRTYRWRERWVYAPYGAWSRSPLEGENREDEHDRPGPSGPGRQSAGSRVHPHPCRQCGERALACQVARARYRFRHRGRYLRRSVRRLSLCCRHGSRERPPDFAL